MLSFPSYIAQFISLQAISFSFTSSLTPLTPGLSILLELPLGHPLFLRLLHFNPLVQGKTSTNNKLVPMKMKTGHSKVKLHTHARAQTRTHASDQRLSFQKHLEAPMESEQKSPVSIAFQTCFSSNIKSSDKYQTYNFTSFFSHSYSILFPGGWGVPTKTAQREVSEILQLVQG